MGLHRRVHHSGRSSRASSYTYKTWICTKWASALSREHHCSINFVSTHVLKTDAQPIEDDINLNNELSQFWELEHIGIQKQEPSVYDKFLQDIKFVDNRYQISLPFKDSDNMILPDNFSMSLKRLKTEVQRLESYKTDILKEYHSVICEQLEQGIVEHVDVAELKEPGTVHYLPHREVLRTDRATTKLRVVYDGSSKQPGELSLNDVLCSGPNLLPHLFDLLLRFRLHKVALTADIERAFLNISVNPNERDLLRFLWFNSIESDDSEIVVLRFTRLVFGLISSPFALGATVRHHLSKYENFDKEFVAEVIRSLYVDDFASGSHSIDSAFVLYQKLKKVFNEGNFNMRKWLSNDPELMNLIEKAETKAVIVGQLEPKLSEILQE